MRSYLIATLPHMEDTLVVKEQLKKCFNLEFSSPAYSRILIDEFKIVTNVRGWAPF